MVAQRLWAMTIVMGFIENGRTHMGLAIPSDISHQSGPALQICEAVQRRQTSESSVAERRGARRLSAL
ncbi:unnamed protein product [Colias eurytheme]|nr:unnamed protein product [Colias eurytheme]